jgi:metallo-beta-lactamase class B
MKRTITLCIAFILSLSHLFAQSTTKDLVITHLTGDFYIYTTYNLYNGNKISANGMYLVTNKGVVIFDSPWDTTQFQPLLDSIKRKHQKSVSLCIPTHFHDDRTAGLEYYRQQGIKTFTAAKTDALSKQYNKKRAEFLITKDTLFNMGNYRFETFYPGEGHTADNIIIWFEKEKILYGSCLIKSVEDKDLGYLGDANKTEYAATIKKVQQKCTQPTYVIIGHGDWTDPTSLAHTLRMAEALKANN